MKIVQGMQTVGGFAKLFGQSVLENFDPDVITRYVGQRADLPQIIYTPMDQMMQARQQRLKEEQMQKMAMLAKTAGPAMAQMTGAAAKAKDSGMLGTNEPFPIPAPGVFDDPSVAQGIAGMVGAPPQDNGLNSLPPPQQPVLPPQ